MREVMLCSKPNLSMLLSLVGGTSHYCNGMYRTFKSLLYTYCNDSF